MKLIVAVDREWGIGYRGKLLATVKEDLAHFRELTVGKTIVYGSVTLRTFPNGRPLKDRINLILSTNPNLKPEGAVALHSVEELIAYEKAHPEEDIVVVGGASVYKQLLPYCDAAYVTRFDASFEKDAYFPNLDDTPGWQCISVSETQYSKGATDTEDGMPYCFAEYRRVDA